MCNTIQSGDEHSDTNRYQGDDARETAVEPATHEPISRIGLGTNG